MPYSDLIRQEGEYNYSANIQFDIENDRKLLRFIPNETTVGLLREYFVDITRAKSNYHSRILYGSYGTGKSHFLTVLSLLLSKTYTDGLAFDSFIKRINEYDCRLASDIGSFISDESKKPFLIVPIVFDFDDFDRCIYFSLKKKLESIGMKISFKTFFDQATGLINQWKKSSDSFERLVLACERTLVSLEKLEKQLSSYDKKAEIDFQKVFSEMTFGVRFIYEVSNLADTLTEASKSISDKYTGIVFIFDEFGRYIEDNIKRIKVKSVQDLAEFCDHSIGNNHIILVSHKEISQYTQRLGKNISSEWKKVEGRYKATPINDKQDQCLSLIRNILVKNNDTWGIFKTTFASELNEMYSEATDFRGFLIDVARDNPFESGFPMHPISLYALDKLSKKVAQNERTFFTYLSSKDDNSLYRFLLKNELDSFHFVGIDEIYDYFEPNIKAVQSDNSYECYKNLQSALSKNHSSIHDDTPEVKILKVIATIGVINDASTLSANKTTLLSVIDCPKEILNNALIGLCERRILKYSGSYDKYDFFEASIYDVEALIDEESKFVKDEAIVKTLNSDFINFVLYPNQYNRDYKISRVFIPTFTIPSELSKRSIINKFGRYYDGVLVMLLADNDDKINNIIEQSKVINRSIVFANFNSEHIKLTVKKYIAVQYLDSQKATYTSKDPSFEKELEYFKREISVEIHSLISEWINNYNEDVKIFSNGNQCYEIKSYTDLSALSSEIMKRCYPDTLIVNNELINKNTISGSISAARKNVINSILREENSSDYYSVQYLSPDYIAIRSVLVKNGFIALKDEVTKNQLIDGYEPQIKLHCIINDFINRSKKEPVCFCEIYSVLKSEPFGLRNGYLSMLFAHVLAPHKKSLIINSHDVEQEVSAELFDEIVRRPDDFSFMIASWSKEQIDYLDSLEQVFNKYINPATISKNRLKAIYESMISHYKNVSKFSRTTQLYLSEDGKTYRKLLEKSNTNYSSFLFKKIKELGGDLINTVSVVKNIKTELENALLSLSCDLAGSISQLFNMSASKPLGELFFDKYEHEWKEKRRKSFDYYTNAFLEYVHGVSKDDTDYSIILNLSKTLTGFELLYWNDSHKDEFINRLNDIKTKLDDYCYTAELSEHEIKMSLNNSSGKEKSIVFENTELSNLSQTVKNKIKATFSNYGLAITYDEKMQVLLSLLDDLMEGK